MTEQILKQEILRLLRKNARMSCREIAERLQIDQAAAEAAIKELENDRTITGYSVLVNEEKVANPPVRALIEVDVIPERDGGFDYVARRISKFPEVISVQLLSGSYDLSLEVVGTSLQEVAYFVASKLSAMEGVKATRTHFLLKKYKQAGFVLQEEEGYERLKVVP